MITTIVTNSINMKTFGIFLASIIAFFAPVAGMLGIMLCLVFLDSITGIYASIKINGIASFRSHKLFNTVVKLFFYLSTILIGFLIDKFIIDAKVFSIAFILAKGITSTWIYVELKSIDENSMKVGNRSIWVILKELFSKAKSIKQDLTTILEEKEDKKETETSDEK